jgi:proton glutamate symport protein
MTQTELLKRLTGLLPSQFEEVLFRASVPIAHLPGEGSPQTTRAIAVIRYLEQQNRLDQLAQILDEVAGPSFVAPSAPPAHSGRSIISDQAARSFAAGFHGGLGVPDPPNPDASGPPDKPAAGSSTRRRSRFTLNRGILLGLVVGYSVGLLFPGFAKNELKPLSSWFLPVINLLLAPFLVTAAIRGVASGTFVWRFIFKVAACFVLSTAAAFAIGLVIVKGFAPGTGIRPSPLPLLDSNKGSLEELASVLPVIFACSAAFGLALSLAEHWSSQSKLFTDILDSAATGFFKLVGYVLYVVPIYASLALAAHVGEYGFDNLQEVWRYVVSVCVALIAYVILLLVAMRLVTRVNVLTFLLAIWKPAVIAFATSTSNAAMPRTMEVLEQLGVPRNIVSFVVPTGSLFNLTGSMLYVFLGVTSMKQSSGHPLSICEQLLLMGFLMLNARSIAGVPHGSFSLLRKRAEGQPALGWLAAIDTLMDMGRTAVNVIGNCVITVIVAAWERQIPPNAPLLVQRPRIRQ